MTIVELILSLRPADDSVASILAAIGRTRIALADMDKAVTEAQEEHDAALLHTDASCLLDAMKKLGKARLETAEFREKASALLRQLEASLPIAKQKEFEAHLDAKRQDAEAAGLALAKMWEKTRVKLAPILREMEQADTKYGAAQLEFYHAVTSAIPLDSERERPRAAPTGSPANGWRDQVAEMAQPARKPVVRAPDPEGDALREEREERLRIGTANYQPAPLVSNAGSAWRAFPS